MKHNITYHYVPRETFEFIDLLFDKHEDIFEQYIGLLKWWNERVNLVSRNVSRETLREHIRHSLLLSKIFGFQNSQRVVDGGTGGGLPGIPLAISHPERTFFLNDIVKKKLLADKQMIRKLGLSNISVLNGSIEDIEMDNSFCLISKHAFKINDLYHMTAHLPWENLIFYKGEDFENELSGIDYSLQINVHRLFSDGRPSFYKGKVLIVTSR